MSRVHKVLRRRLVRIALLALVSSVIGCAYPLNIYYPAVQTALARDNMRTLTTPHIEMFYPEQYREDAEVLASRMETCIGQLSTLVQGTQPDKRLSVVFTSGEFNNAYVSFPTFGQPQRMVLPLHEGYDFFNYLNMGVADVPQISCHESVHYITGMQSHGFWGGFNKIFGEAYLPVASLPLWVHEGMATYYEAQLGGEFGRPKSLLWRGIFEAAVASEGGDLRAGDLNAGKRAWPFGGWYQTGMHFVEYLCHRYGDTKLWELIDVQSESFFSVFGITLRFKQVFGGTIDELFEEFTDHMKSTLVVRERPSTQKVIAQNLGNFARMTACGAERALVLVTDDVDEMPRLTARERDGKVRFTRLMTDILPVRDQVAFSGYSVSGLSCASDGNSIYFVAADVGIDNEYVNKLWQIDAHTGNIQQIWLGIEGIGGSVRPDGGTYAYVALKGVHAYLAEIDLETGEHRTLPAMEGVTSVGAPAYSPDGTRLAFAARTPAGFNLFMRDAQGQMTQLSDDARGSFGAHWMSSNELLFIREHEGRLQAHRMNVDTDEVHALSDAPYAVLDVAPLDAGHIAILSAEGFGWSLDEVTVPATLSQTTLADAPIAPDLPSVPEMLTEPAPMTLIEAPTAAASALTSPAGIDKHAPVASCSDEPVKVVSDTDYSGYMELLRPKLVLPFYNGGCADSQCNIYHNVVGLSVMGSDALAYHTYGANIAYDFVVGIPQVGLAYVNYQLAPTLVQIYASQLPNFSGTYLEQSGNIAVTRSFFGADYVGLQLVGLRRTGRHGVPKQDVQVWGPSLSLGYNAADGTPYAGALRRLGAGLTTAVYPDVPGVGAHKTLVDVRLQLSATVPLPLSKRHSLSVNAFGRQMFNTHQKLFAMGAGGSVNQLADALSFHESVRGYSLLHAWAANRMAVVEVDYEYPIIIDYGWHSLLWLFPQLFIREVDIDLFGTFAWSNSRVELHRAAGAQIAVPLSIGEIYFTPQVQVSRRFDEFAGYEVMASLYMFGYAWTNKDSPLQSASHRH